MATKSPRESENSVFIYYLLLCIYHYYYVFFLLFQCAARGGVIDCLGALE